MAIYAFTVPVLSGKTEDLKRYLNEMNGPRRNEYHQSTQKAGLQMEQMWLQQTPQGDMVVVVWDTDNPKRVFDHALKSNDPFDKWFRDKVIIECVGFDPTKDFPLNEKISDFHLQGAETKKHVETGKR